jgi:hypothetical protein
MKLPNFYEFEPLNAVKAKMGIPRNSYGSLTIVIAPGRLTELELEKLTSSNGLDISVDDLTILSDETLAYKDSRVLLYIRDFTVYSGRGSEPRFHLGNCRTLKEMRENNRFNRYVVSIKTDGWFNLNVIKSGRARTELYNLSVCQNCLDMLIFDSFEMKWEKNKRLNFVREFKIESFFEKYPKSLHAKTPLYNSDNAPLNVYADDFKGISRSIRSAANWCCQQCGINLSAPENRKWLHVHHKNGLKHDNSRSNLEALCIGCHAKEPGHAHMKSNLNYLEFTGEDISTLSS